MKKTFLLLFMGLFAGQQSSAETKCFIAKEAGTVLLKDGNCSERHSPCSTFKIAISLMGYNEGFLVSETHPELPYEEKYGAWVDVWKKQQNPTSWIQNSVIWYSQVITQKLGTEKFKDYVTKFDYGNQDLSGDKGKDNGLTHSWLSRSLQISTEEQVDFLEKLIFSKLPVSEKAQLLTRNLLFLEELPDGWKLYGKTGSGFQTKKDGSRNRDLQIGWFVGWVEKDDRRIVFANYLEDEEKNDIPAGKRAKEITKDKVMKLIGAKDGSHDVVSRSVSTQYPEIIDGAGGSVEKEVFAFAKDVFKSDAFDWEDHLQWQTLKSDAARVVLIPGAYLGSETNNGEEYLSDDTIAQAEQIRDSDSSNFWHVRFYWSKVPNDRHAFLVFQKPFNWAGDWYSLYWLSYDVIRKLIMDPDSYAPDKIEEQLKPYKIAPLSAEGWQKPFLLQTKKDNAIVAVFTDHPATPLSDWTVHIPLEKDKLQVSKIRFRPDVKDPKLLFQEGSLRELISLLDEILGKSTQNEGTLQPTASLRVFTEKVVFNLAIRPWAVKNGKVYNTTAEVESGLKTWSSRNKKLKTKLKRLKDLYVPAQNELITYYKSNFGYAESEAKTLAEQNLDLFYRGHFAFTKKR